MSSIRGPAGLNAIRFWLFIVAFLVFCMVLVGGATRLTDSGLSITEWQPLLGAIPPMSEADWLVAFAKYKQIPEYAAVNSGMTIDEFKFIYWWEWSHRFLGRFIGIAFLLPFLFFWVTRRLPSRLILRLAGIFVLGGLQGALGWYMVASGLSERVDVSQYRLAAHLVLASVIFAAILWTAMALDAPHRSMRNHGFGLAALLIPAILAQIGMGGFVAGIDAGMGYNTWPLMDGKIVPDGLWAMTPAWRNLFENALTVQFTHRMIAYALTILIALNAWWMRSAESVLLLVVVLLQIGLGILTLLLHVPLGLALCHQGGALLLLAAALWNLHRLSISRSPAPDRQ